MEKRGFCATATTLDSTSHIIMPMGTGTQATHLTCALLSRISMPLRNLASGLARLKDEILSITMVSWGEKITGCLSNYSSVAEWPRASDSVRTGLTDLH